MLGNLFIKRGARSRLNLRAKALLKMADFEVSSANCTLVQTAAGEPVQEDLGTTLLLKYDGQLMIREHGLFATVPEAIKTETRGLLQGNGEIIKLWFLHERVPRVLECEVEKMVHLPLEVLQRIDPKVGAVYRLAPLSDVIKQDKRSSLRFTHVRGRAALPVYPQILFDTVVWKTDQTYPEDGPFQLWIEDLKAIPHNQGEEGTPGSRLNLEQLVQEFKEAMKANYSEDRNVHVSKPITDEKQNRSILLELGYSDVLGLGSEEIGRNLHIKKPINSRIKDRRDPSYLKVEDTLVLHYGARSVDGSFNYYELVSEVSKGGLENITLRPQMQIKVEKGLQVGVVDFSVNGFRFDNSDVFLEYLLGKDWQKIPLEDQMVTLENMVILFNFYPRLRFNRDTDAYRPLLPKRISILGKIVRSEVEKDEEKVQFKSFGVKFMYAPIEYSSERFTFEKWEMIRPFKENRYFKEVHKSLNGLIAFLESQSRE